MPKPKNISLAAVKVLAVAVKRDPPCVLPLPAGVQGIAAHSLLNTLRTRGLIDHSIDSPCITDAGRDLLIGAGYDWVRK